MRLRRGIGLALFAGALALCAAGVPNANAAAAPARVTVTGEIVDTWCYITEIMYSVGTAHHQCAVWCAIGGIPVSILGDDGKVYMVLRIEGDDTSVSNPTIVTIQTHKVTVDGDLYRRDGVNYLIVTTVADDHGIVNLTHDEYGIQPFGK
jgi:anaerobic selenocysteine-containing dehydrogenase